MTEAKKKLTVCVHVFIFLKKGITNNAYVYIKDQIMHSALTPGKSKKT